MEYKKVNLGELSRKYNIPVEDIQNFIEEFYLKEGALPTYEKLISYLEKPNLVSLKENVAAIARIIPMLQKAIPAIVKFASSPTGKLLIKLGALYLYKKIESGSLNQDALKKDQNQLKSQFEEYFKTIFGNNAPKIINNVNQYGLDREISNKIDLDFPYLKQLQSFISSNDILKGLVIEDDSTKKYLLLKAIITNTPLSELEKKEMSDLASGSKELVESLKGVEQTSSKDTTQQKSNESEEAQEENNESKNTKE